MSKKLVIKFPESAVLPQGLAEEQELLRYSIAASLYRCGALSDRGARELTGDSRRRFEEKMAEYGFSMAGTDPDDVVLELDA